MHSFGLILPAAIALVGAAPPNEFAVEASEAGSPGATRYFQVAAGDLNGDGRADAAVLKVQCDGGQVSQAWLAPRDRATGQATGKRQHKPMTMVTAWDKATPLRDMKATYDVKKVEGTGAKTAAGDGWTAVDLTPAAYSLCALKVSN